MLYKSGSRNISFEEILPQEIAVLEAILWRKGSFYVTVLRDDKIFLKALYFFSLIMLLSILNLRHN